VNENPNGEWTIRIETQADAARIQEMVFGTASTDHLYSDSALARLDEDALRDIELRSDIGPTEKEQLILARRGQGRYRQNLGSLETRCRVTQVSDPRHLRASHIKPWRKSDDREKLDANNGLLLSPHVDHLFDRGFISFTDAGDMMVSKHLNPSLLTAWGLGVTLKTSAFSPEQCVYLEYHRREVFQN
jgi:putative restriction endonuclease